MKKLKVVTVVGTRPEIIRLSSIINRLNDSAFIEHTLIHTGQNYDKNLNDIFLFSSVFPEAVTAHVHTHIFIGLISPA